MNNELNIVVVLQQHADAYARLEQKRNIYSELLKHGREFEAQPLPDGITRGEARECFNNSLALADDIDLVYCEGFAIRPEFGLLIHHAWLIDPDERVIDRTWERPETCKYFGIDFQANWVFELGYTGLALERFLIHKANEEDRAAADDSVVGRER